jgi:hypothetical protein
MNAITLLRVFMLRLRDVRRAGAWMRRSDRALAKLGLSGQPTRLR